jgi:hypothetical protein
MTNLHDRLDLLAGPAPAPSPAQADADLARGRRALRRRRAVQQVGASVFAVAAVAAVVTYGTSGDNAAPKPEAGPVSVGPVPVEPAAPVSPQTVATRLVAYHGEQPKGFTIDKVPDGWEVQGVSAAALTIAPIGFEDQHPDSFVGKIVVMLQSADDKSTPTGTKVDVDGKPGVINDPDDPGHTRNLWVKQPNGIWMQVQIWDARGWTPASMAEFAAGIHVLKGAQQGRG